MFTRIRALRTRPAGVLGALLLVLVLGACDTQPATEVDAGNAVLNGKGACTAGVSGYWYYQLRNASAGGSFEPVGPRHDFGCASNTGEVALESYRVTGLTPQTRYQFRIASRLSDGSTQRWDSNGTNDGTAYDSFTTPAPRWRDVDDTTSEASDDPGLCDNGTDACASSALRRCKGRFRPLRNIHRSEIDAFWTAIPGDYYPVWGAQTLSAWCWYAVPHKDAGKIYWRHTTAQAWSDSAYGGVSFGADYWYSSACFDGNRWCLTRREVQAIIGIQLPGALPDIADHQWICIATRVSGGGTHGRAIHKSKCSADRGCERRQEGRPGARRGDHDPQRRHPQRCEPASRARATRATRPDTPRADACRRPRTRTWSSRRHSGAASAR